MVLNSLEDIKSKLEHRLPADDLAGGTDDTVSTTEEPNQTVSDNDLYEEDDLYEDDSEDDSEDDDEEPVVSSGNAFLEKEEDSKSSYVNLAELAKKQEEEPESGLGKLGDKLDIPKKEKKNLGEEDTFLSGGFMSIDREAFKIQPTQEINIEELAYSTPMKNGRKDTITGLTKSVRESGVLSPIDVTLLPPVDEEMKEALEEDGEVAPKYMLVDGLRRVFASLKTGNKTIPAKVWVFKDLEMGQKISLELGLWLNRSQPHSWKEIWDLSNVLEEKTHIKPAMQEFLFHLNGGDYMKLKDVMLCDYPEIREDMLNEKKTLEQSYKALMKQRQEEDELEIADTKGLSDASEDASKVVEEENEDNDEKVETLEDEQVKKIMEMVDKTDEEDPTEEDFNEMNDDSDATVQDTKHRTYVDPAIKKAVLFRDNFKCTCCGTGGAAFLDVLIFHHIIPVHAGGPDTVDNGTTLCDTCHLTLHVAERNKGRLPMSKEQFDEYSPEQKQRIMNILKLGRAAYESDKVKGYSIDKINKLAREAATHRMPGERIKDNLALYKDYQNNKGKVEGEDKKVKNEDKDADNSKTVSKESETDAKVEESDVKAEKAEA